MSNLYFLLIFVFNFFFLLYAGEALKVTTLWYDDDTNHLSNLQYNLRIKRHKTISNEFGSQTYRQCFYKNVKKCFDGAFTSHDFCLDHIIYSKLAKHYWDQAIYPSYTPNFQEHFINCSTAKLTTIIEPNTPAIFKALNKLKGIPSPRLGSKLKLVHQECIEEYTWKCVINLSTLNCYMNMSYNEIAEIVNSCSNQVYTKLGISLHTFEDVKVTES